MFPNIKSSFVKARYRDEGIGLIPDIDWDLKDPTSKACIMMFKVPLSPRYDLLWLNVGIATVTY